MDYSALVIFIAAQMALCIAVTPSAGDACLKILLGVVLPFLVWNYVMAFITIQHHTHPGVRWYADESAWSFYKGQLCSTVHVIWPGKMGALVDWGCGRFFHHSAHHVVKHVPLYKLTAAQQVLRHEFSGDIVIQPFSWTNFVTTLRTCQLYDYEAHRWLTINR